MSPERDKLELLVRTAPVSEPARLHDRVRGWIDLDRDEGLHASL